MTTNANGVDDLRGRREHGRHGKLEGDNKADDQGTTETGAAVIENVNNGTVGATRRSTTLSPLNGTITFTVDSVEADCAVAVLFEDSDAALWVTLT